MRAAIIQSNYIPWRGYFDFIDEVDLFIFYDDTQYTKRDWRNRNKIKTKDGACWISVPVHYHNRTQTICETRIDTSQNWQCDHLNAIRENYVKAPYIDIVLDMLHESFSKNHLTISELNIDLTRRICNFLGIDTPLRFSSDYSPTGTRTDRLVDLLLKVGATTYLSGPTAKGYLDENKLLENGICLEYKAYDYPEYPQLWGEFDNHLSIIDLIANTGQDATKYLKSSPPYYAVTSPNPSYSIAHTNLAGGS